MIYDIKLQFDLVRTKLETDYIGMDDTFHETNHNFFYQLQLIEDRNIKELLPVMETICGYNFSNNKYKNNCIDVPKIEYSIVNGQIVATPVVVETITGNDWVPIIKDVLQFEHISSKLDELYNITDIFYNKLGKYGMDYIARSDMAKNYVCNSLQMMRAVGNLYIHIQRGLFMQPTITESYIARNDSGDTAFIPAELIFSGIIANQSGMVLPHAGVLDDFITFLDDFIVQLNTFNIENQALEAGTSDEINEAEIRKSSFLTSPAFDSRDSDGVGIEPANFCIAALIEKANLFRAEIDRIINAKIDLVTKSNSALEYFEKILKIISSVAIVYNTSTEANQLQKALLKESDDNSIETRIATQNAMETKWSYSQAEISKGIMIATKKSINYFNYQEVFETIIDGVFEQGIPQYDQITT